MLGRTRLLGFALQPWTLGCWLGFGWLLWAGSRERACPRLPAGASRAPGPSVTVVVGRFLPPSNPQPHSCYNAAVFPKILALGLVLTAPFSLAQEAAPSQQQPQVKVNMLNVCSPSKEEQQEIASALSRIPKHPSFSEDFEVDRGRSLLDPGANPLVAQPESGGLTTAADFIRLRHDLSGGAFLTVQYSFSRDSEQMVETLAFRVRDPKDLLQVSIEDSASSVTTATAMLGSSTPASRIRLERFGKSSVVLARCRATQGPAPDQSAYEPLFASASSILEAYRSVLGARTLVPEELARLNRTAGRPARSGSSPKHP